MHHGHLAHMVTTDTFVTAYDYAIGNNTFINSTEVTNMTEVVTHPLLFTVAQAKWNAAQGKRYRYQVYTGTLYGGIIMAYWAFVMAVGIVFNLVRFFAPKYLINMNSPALIKFRQKFVVPATFRFKHSTPTILGNIPTRPQTIVLLGYLIMNIVLVFVHYDITIFEVKKLQLAQHVADRTGIIAFAHFPAVFLFAGRNNMLLWLTGWSFDTFNAYHRWLSRGMVIHALIHSFAWSVYCWMDGSYKSMFKVGYWNYGVAATVFGCAILIQSTRILRARGYEVFLVLHILFAIAFTVGCVWHSYYMGWMQWIWAAIAIWAFDRFLRVAKIALNGYSYAEAKLYHDNGSDVFKMAISTANAYQYKPGTHVFIHFLKPWGFWQSHPFTVYRSPIAGQEHELMVCGKAAGGMTKTVAQDLAKHPNGFNDNLLVALDGPYGHHHGLEHYDTAIFVAGGIGVTSTYSYTADLITRMSSVVSKEGSGQRIVFIWITSQATSLDWFGREMQFLCNSGACDVELYITGNSHISMPSSSASLEKNISQSDIESTAGRLEKVVDADSNLGLSGERTTVIQGRPDVYELLTSHIAASTGSTGVMVCGPPSLNDTVRKCTAQNLGNAKGRVDYFEEAFAW